MCSSQHRLYAGIELPSPTQGRFPEQLAGPINRRGREVRGPGSTGGEHAVAMMVCRCRGAASWCRGDRGAVYLHSLSHIPHPTTNPVSQW